MRGVSATSRLGAAVLVGGAVLCGVTACEPGPADARPALLRLVRPRLDAAGLSGVFLNEELRLYFSAPLDRTTVTRENVRLVDERGNPAHGRLEVAGDCVRFLPDLPRRRDLSDGGLQPGTNYTLELHGFPRPDGLRSAQGALFSGTLRAPLRTVEREGEGGAPRTWNLFDDAEPQSTGFLRPLPRLRPKFIYQAGSAGSILLFCEKPIDPTTVIASEFQLTAVDGTHTLELTAQLVENEPRSAARGAPPALRGRDHPSLDWLSTRRAAVVELLPHEQPAPGARYILRVRSDAVGGIALRDFSGRSLRPAWRDGFEVNFGGGARSTPSGQFDEEFLDDTFQYRSFLAVPGFDGTPAWTGNGRLEVRYPAAAGHGGDGAVVLGGQELRRDVHATRLELPAGQACELAAGGGPLVLRSQTRLSIAGDLVRRGPGCDGRALAAAHPELFETPPGGSAAVDFSAWLARAQASSVPWTILIAGGDLVIDGSLRCETPLFLCAGGRIRIAGLVRGHSDDFAGQIWQLGEGGGLDMSPRADLAARFLILDPPRGPNPLRVPLRLCAVSAVLNDLLERERAQRWLGADLRTSAYRAKAAPASVRVHFVADSGPELPADVAQRWTNSPALIVDSGGGAGLLRYLVEIEIQPGGQWDPPFLDALRLSWEAAGGPR